MRHMLACILHAAPELDRESAAEKVLCCLETSVRGIFSLVERTAFYKLWKHRQTSLFYSY